MPEPSSRGRAFTRVAVAYAVALVVAILVGALLGSQHPIASAAGADVAATLVIFLFSVAFDNSSFYDPYWSVAVPPIAVYWALGSDVSGVDTARVGVVVTLATLWSVRLTYNWAHGFGGLDHEDWRYADIRERSGRLYWPVSLLGIHLLPTVMVFLGCLPLYAAVAAGTAPFGALDVAGLAVTGGALWIEARADRELRLYRRAPRAAGEFLRTGLWKYSRHPNYFGEIMFWWGLFLFGLAAAPSYWWTGVGAVGITLLFWLVSLPLIEARMRASRPDFAGYAATTSVLVPWLPRETPPEPSGPAA